MKEIPSLFSLCVKTITWNLIHGFEQLQDLFELPSIFLDELSTILPPLALQNIHELLDRSIGSTTKEASIVNRINIRRKRGRYNELNTAWETLYKKRWPESIKKKQQSSCTMAYHGMKSHESTAPVIDWQQLYWERHLQDCLDAVTEQALLPAFDGNITELEIPDNIMSLIGHVGIGVCGCSSLSYHCIKFGCYARYVRLHSVICHEEISDLLRTSKLEALVFRRILSGSKVDEVCHLIKQNSLTLVSIELVYCRLSPSDVDMICSSVYSMETHNHGIQHFSIKSSIIIGSNSSSIPNGLTFFLSSGRLPIYVRLRSWLSHVITKTLLYQGVDLIFNIKGLQAICLGDIISNHRLPNQAFLAKLIEVYISKMFFSRSLHSVCFADTHMGLKSTEAIIETLIQSSSLVSLELSGNELEGWLSKIGRRYTSLSLVPESNTSFKSLIELNLRGSSLHKNDIVGLQHMLVSMPKLLRLELSDNPIGDEGVRTLISFFVKAFKETSQASEIWLENCDISGAGVSELLQSLAMNKYQLKTLSFAENDLGSSVAAPLANFLGSSRIRNLNIEGIGLGPFGFQELTRKMLKETALAHLNVSKNRGGIQAAHFIHHIISKAPDIVSINAGSNLLPPESLSIIEDALSKSNGKLEQVDLTGNASLYSLNSESVISQFQFRGNPIIRLPSFCPTSSAYDDDP